MDKNAIKKYAVWARRELISRVRQRAALFGITEESAGDAGAVSVNGHVLSDSEVKQRKALIAKITDKGYQEVMEEVAYTWFNRFAALRFMEVNGYLPSHVRVFTDDENNFKPQILTEAINLELDGLDMDKVYALKNLNDNDELFKYLIIVQCNALNAILPGMFQKIDDYTELLFPDNLLRDGSALEQMIALIPEDDWKDAVQIIGWLYQYYNTEKKDDVFAALKRNVKITKENIPAATQLFTPDWIVRYMVENSLGRLWLEGHPNDDLKSEWKYYLDEAEQEPQVQTKLAAIRKEYAALTPEQIKCIDPCSGSGHILAYMFDVLMQIYEAYGYTAREAVASIVENNLYGLDIDDRAAQLASFAVMMKARQYDRRFFSRGIQPHVYAIVESNHISQYTVDYFANGDEKLKKAIRTIMDELHDAKEYGSILTVTPQDWSALFARFDEIEDDISMYRNAALEELLPLVQVAQAMAQKYDTVITNPPYMGASGMGAKLSDFVKQNYPDSKGDLSTICMERTLKMCKQGGYMSMINIPVWMFIVSYSKLRKKLLDNSILVNMVHPGRGIFGSDFGTTSFVFKKGCLSEYVGSYYRLFDTQGEVLSVKEREESFLRRKGFYSIKQKEFSKIPGSPIAYWVSKAVLSAYSNIPALSTVADPKKGMSTADDNRFLRFWHEISKQQFWIFNNDRPKWYRLNKGGSFRRWYGNNEYVVNWYENGMEMKAFKKAVIRNEAYYMREHGLTWTYITNYKFNVRYYENSIFAAAGPCIFVNKYPEEYILGYLNTKVAQMFVDYVGGSTITYEIGEVSTIPVVDCNSETKDCVINTTKQNLHISKTDWDAFETSWDFSTHPLVRWSKELWDATGIGAAMQKYYGGHPEVSCPLELCFMLWQGECDERFNQLKANEEELNRIFIDIYGLQDELTPEVEDKDVTVRKADLTRDIKSFISYAVGCMFGRYSLNVEGLAFAGGEWNPEKYRSFPADADNIIPICDDEYFADDIVGRFVDFVRVVFGEETLNDNLKYIADALGGKGQPKDVIRNYFINGFYADHCKMYQKRPIYWLFDSGKKNGFKALIYMHRYQPDTIARLRTDYVHEQQSRYRTAIADSEQRISVASTSERVKLTKHLASLQDQSNELHGYEEKIHHLADQYIPIDLDDGVKKNYEIFKDVLAKIK